MLPQESLDLKINVPVKMRDGTTLYADVYRPNTKKRYPAILVRLPYVKNSPFLFNTYMDPLRMARAGYALVAQDCRGTGASEGEYHQFINDAEDGYDTVEWVAAQPWCDGNVGMYGLSYLGATQMLAAIMHPPHLKAICPAQVSHSLRGMPMWENGVFLLQLSLMWLNSMIASELAKGDMPPEKLKSLRKRALHIVTHPEESHRFLPLINAPPNEIARELRLGSVYSEWMTHLEDDAFWKRLYNPVPLEEIAIPALHLWGWYHHVITSAVLANYRGIKERGASELARRNQKLLVGPWVSVGGPGVVGELDYGPSASGSAIDLTRIHLRWFDYWLKGIDNGIMDEPPVRIFVMGDNLWRDENEWPLARTRYAKYYFHSAGHANGRSGDGVLSAEPPAEEEPDIYLYNPRNPVPTQPVLGTTFVLTIFEPHDQQDTEKRTDILVYTTPVLEADIEVTGPIVVKLYASSSAVDTDFTGKLVDVWPDGRAYNVVDGIIRARYRKSISKPELIKPDKVYEYTIDLRSTSMVFKAGHMIRVEISSSNFPKWDRNLNTGHPIGQDAEIKVALQTIFHSQQYPSHIVLPVIPREV
jgi:putative CocE/NonD family hydrolase